MELIRGAYSLNAPHRGCIATIGNFDGVHLGHQAILSRLAQHAQTYSLPSVLLTFEPQPVEFFTTTPPARLTTLREKLMVLRELPLDRLVCLRFNAWLAALSPEQFIHAILVEGLRIRCLVVGDDFRFGRNRTGDFASLNDAGRRFGFTVEATPTVNVDGGRVSSSRIRQALSLGDLAGAARLLGRPYSLWGRVAHGDRRGRTLGFPTANLRLKRKVLPVRGVFAIHAMLGSERFPGVANIGFRPTVAGREARLEAHLFDLDRDLYGRRLEVTLMRFIRPEQRFPDLATLKAQIAQDAAQARAYFAEQDPTR